MGIDEVDVFEVEALEGGGDTFNDVFPGKTFVVYGVRAVRCSPIDL